MSRRAGERGGKKLRIADCGLRIFPNFRHFGFSDSQRAGLVKNHGGDFARLLQSHAVANQNSAPRGGIGTCHDGGGCCQTHCARTGNDEHGGGDDETCRHTGRRVRVPEKLRQRAVNLIRRFRRKAPPQSGGDGDGNDDRHEHAAHAVAEALDAGAAGLGALHGGDDVRERGAFAGGGHAHDEPAVQIDRAGEQFAAGFFVRGNGFAGEHCLVHGGIAFNNDTVHRHAVAGFEHDEIPGLQFGNGNFNFGVRSSEIGAGNPPRGLRGEGQQRFQRAGRAVAYAGLQPMTRADERDDGGGFHEINVPARAAEQSPGTIAERGRRAEGDEGVHVGAADFELVPRAAVKSRAGENLDGAGQRKGEPLKPRLQAEAENPFANHEESGDEDAQPQVELPVLVSGFAAGGSVSLDFLRFVTGLFDGCDDGGDILLRAGIPTHRGAPAFKHHRRAVDAGHALNGVGHVPRAVLAIHAGDEQFRRGGILPGIRFGCMWRLHLLA